MTSSSNLSVLLTSPAGGFVDDLCAARPGTDVQVIGVTSPDVAPGRTVVCYIDWLTADMSGLELCRRLRAAPGTRDAHITMVLEDTDPDAMRRALRAGADDYVIGPLDPNRVLNDLDRYSPAPASIQPGPPRHGELIVDRTAHQARWRGQPVALRPNEFRLLCHFLENPDQLFSRAALIERIGKDAGTIDERTVDVWIGRLRRALGVAGVPDPLRTVRAMGYVLDSLPA